MVSSVEQYFQELTQLLGLIEYHERDGIATAAQWAAETIERDGIIHVFGTGHSHMAGEEMLYRAGGLACFNGILVPELMLHEGAAESTMAERKQGLAEEILERYQLQEGDLMIIVSNSGVNAVPVEAALYCQDKGLRVVAVGSRAYAEAAEAKLGQKLLDTADLFLDNHLPPGDALIPIPGTEGKAGPGSTVAMSAILHGIALGAMDRLAGQGTPIPYYISANIPGAQEHNRSIMQRYKHRIKHL